MADLPPWQQHFLHSVIHISQEHHRRRAQSAIQGGQNGQDAANGGGVVFSRRGSSRSPADQNRYCNSTPIERGGVKL